MYWKNELIGPDWSGGTPSLYNGELARLFVSGVKCRLAAVFTVSTATVSEL